MGDVLSVIVHGGRVDQRVRCDALADQLIGVAASRVPSGGFCSSPRPIALVAKPPLPVHELGVRAVSLHLLSQWAVLHAVGDSKHAVERARVFEKRGQAGHHLQALQAFLEFELHDGAAVACVWCVGLEVRLMDLLIAGF